MATYIGSPKIHRFAFTETVREALMEILVDCHERHRDKAREIYRLLRSSTAQPVKFPLDYIGSRENLREVCETTISSDELFDVYGRPLRASALAGMILDAAESWLSERGSEPQHDTVEESEGLA